MQKQNTVVKSLVKTRVPVASVDILNDTYKYDEDYESLAASNFLHLDRFMCAMDIRSNSVECSAASLVNSAVWLKTEYSELVHPQSK